MAFATEIAQQILDDKKLRKARRLVMIRYLRAHIDEIGDMNLRRKIMLFPSDLSDERMAKLVLGVAGL